MTMRSLLAFILLAVVVHGVPTQPEPSKPKRQLWMAMGEFGHSLLKHTAEQTAKSEENILISPLSVHSALSMVVPGAQGETKEEMVRTLQLGGIESEDFKKAFSELTSRKHENTTRPNLWFIMKLANRIYAQKDYPLAPAYVDDIKSTFHAEAVNVDFAANAGAVKDEINDFVKQKTNNLIPKILQDPLNTDTVMILVNTLYFKGSWRDTMSKFDEALVFNKGCGGLEKEQNKWLGITDEMLYLESADLNAKLIQIPYKFDVFKASMLIVVPNGDYNCKFNEWLQGVKWSSIQEELTKMKYTNVNFKMPPLEIGYRTELQDVLPNMGMPLVFKKGEANLSMMLTDPNERLNIDQVIHETKMIVNEFGTEAAAVTTVRATLFSARPAPPKPVRMVVDRSFYVAILYQDLGANKVLPLFAGFVHRV